MRFKTTVAPFEFTAGSMNRPNTRSQTSCRPPSYASASFTRSSNILPKCKHPVSATFEKADKSARKFCAVTTAALEGHNRRLRILNDVQFVSYSNGGDVQTVAARKRRKISEVLASNKTEAPTDAARAVGYNRASQKMDKKPVASEPKVHSANQLTARKSGKGPALHRGIGCNGKQGLSNSSQAGRKHNKINTATSRNPIKIFNCQKDLTPRKISPRDCSIEPLNPPANSSRNRKRKHQRDTIIGDVMSDFSGFSDDRCSVVSGLLEEGICFECGVSTHLDDWNTLVICDICEGEYHAGCVCDVSSGQLLPRVSFVCQRCKEEALAFKDLKYVVHSMFKLPKRRVQDKRAEFCYSPSKPLGEAWKELVSKGFMCVSRVFPFEVMRKLTHGTVTRQTQSGRVAETWHGACSEISKRINAHVGINMVNRDGRFDLQVPEFVISSLGIDVLLAPILELLTTVMGQPRPAMRTHNIIFVPVGSGAQRWHFDDCSRMHKNHRYFTILIHLNPVDSFSGGTEIYSKETKSSDLIRPRPGDAFVFHGALEHRGQANVGLGHRLFYYGSFACRQDANTANDN